ncbi:hypothetical protein [Paraburkholderia sp. BL6669N2]|uniref:hypothetical protein n=1 Tax=Paraburkholderia sp. BL6669N2 TaxID=1938807 RepID=UPI0011C04746|nr:hypothetical protein [Paraburkholderia sp. BL6669N2]
MTILQNEKGESPRPVSGNDNSPDGQERKASGQKTCGGPDSGTKRTAKGVARATVLQKTLDALQRATSIANHSRRYRKIKAVWPIISVRYSNEFDGIELDLPMRHDLSQAKIWQVDGCADALIAESGWDCIAGQSCNVT